MKQLSLALCAAALCVPVGTVTAAPVASSSASGKKVERKIVRCANRERKKRGLKKLKVAKPLAKAARRHAKNMLRKGFTNHVDPKGRTPQDRVDAIDPFHWAVGENISWSRPDVKSTCNGWMHSPGHRFNILYPLYTHIGGGFAKGKKNYGRYYVQVFAFEQPSFF